MGNLPEIKNLVSCILYLVSKRIPRSFELFPQHGCQVVYHRPPKLPETGNTFSRSFLSKKVVRPL